MNILKKIVAGLLIFTPVIALAQIAPAPNTSGGSLSIAKSGANDGNSYSGYLVNQPGGVAYSQSYALDLSVYDASKVSAQLVISTVIFSNPTFTDGSQSTGSVKVISVTGLSSATATDSITIINNSFTTIPALTVANNVLTMGQQWSKGATAHASAVNLAAAISLLPNLSANAGGGTSGVVYATATYGSYANSWAVTSNNSSMTVAGATFTGGADNACLTINGVALCNNGAWSAGASVTTAALSLGNAIAKTVAVSTSSPGATGVIYATSTLNGSAYNYTLATSTPTVLSVWQPAMVNGTNPGDVLGSKVITASGNTGFPLALPVLWAIGANTAIGGLTTGTTYYAYPVSATQFELVKYASSAFAGAPASDFVTITGTNTHVAALTYTVAPLGFSAAFSTMTWQSSDDNVDWFTSQYTGNVSTGAVVLTPTSVPQDIPIDFGVFNYRYLRLNFTAPASGAVNLVVPINVKQDGIGRY